MYDKRCADCEGEGSITRDNQPIPCSTCDGYGSLLAPAGRELLEFLKRRGVRVPVSSISDEQEQRSR